MLRLWRRALYKEPFDGTLPWMNLGVGCLGLSSGLFITLSGGPTFLFIGLTLLALGLMFRSAIILTIAGLPQMGLNA